MWGKDHPGRRKSLPDRYIECCKQGFPLLVTATPLQPHKSKAATTGTSELQELKIIQFDMESAQIVSTCRQARPLVDVGLESRILLPTDTEYTSRIDSYWCNNAKLKPACILQPRSASEVAKAIKALAQARQEFAVRAGGHMNWAGSNNINGGVTIDLGFLNSTQYDPDTQRARLGPGAKWKNVYAELEKHGRTVLGAKEAECGVGGFLLGGGNTFHTPSHGFACDNVVAYEVVLADGRIVTADAGGEHKGAFFFYSTEKTPD